MKNAEMAALGQRGGRPRGRVPLKLKLARAFEHGRKTLIIYFEEFEELRQLLMSGKFDPVLDAPKNPRKLGRGTPTGRRKRTIAVLRAGESVTLSQIDEIDQYTRQPSEVEKRLMRKYRIDLNELSGGVSSRQKLHESLDKMDELVAEVRAAERKEKRATVWEDAEPRKGAGR